MIFWNLYYSRKETNHSIEFTDLKCVNPNKITDIIEEKDSGLTYLRFVTYAITNSDFYYYPGSIEDFNTAMEDVSVDLLRLNNPFIVALPKLDKSTFMFTDKSITQFEENQNDARTLTINLEKMISDMDKQWNDICGENNEESDETK